VPLIMTNGHLYQFGMATLLEHIPVLHILTNVLDANNPSAIDEIAKFLTMFRSFMIQQAVKLEHCVGKRTFDKDSESTHFSFDKDKYHLKLKSNIFNRHPPTAVERLALPLLWHVFETLSDLDEVVKPLGYGELKGIEAGCENGCLVFNNLYREGFVMGVPTEQVAYGAFCIALNTVIHKIHTRGIIHVDLYPSNILWLNNDGEIKVRIIDWDAATFSGQQYLPKMMERFKKCENQYYVQEKIAKAENDAWHVFILSNLNLEQRKSLHGASVSDVPNVNRGYQQCISDKIKTSGGIEKLKESFLNWFESFFSKSRESSVLRDA
jgi:serine/threonine protein kinase